MVPGIDALNPWVIASVAINVIAVAMVAAAVLKRQRRERRQKRRADAVTHAVIDYFQRTGVGVAAGCITLNPDRYTVFIESEPMKRFRLSHIIEATVREHVKKACGAEVEKIYWRFPIAQNAVNEADEGKPVETPDEYINEGLVHYRHLPKVEVTELPWENFEQVSQRGETQPGAAGEP